MNGLLPKKLIYECELRKNVEFDGNETLFYLERALEKEADLQRWCPDWTYEICPTDESNVFDVKVYGEFEED